MRKRTKSKVKQFKVIDDSINLVCSAEYRMCKSKHPYESERIARKKADELESEFGSDKLRVYKCDICKKFHFTKRI